MVLLKSNEKKPDMNLKKYGTVIIDGMLLAMLIYLPFKLYDQLQKVPKDNFHLFITGVQLFGFLILFIDRIYTRYKRKKESNPENVSIN